MTTGTARAEQAQRTLRHRIEHTRASLARDAQDLADEAARYATRIAKGGADDGGSSTIAQDALQLAVLATRLTAMTEAGEYLDAAVGESTAEGPDRDRR